MQSIGIKFGISKQFLALIAVVGIGTIGIVCALPISIWIKIALICSVFCYLAPIVWRYVLLRHRDSCLGLSQDDQGVWQLHYAGHVQPAQLLGESTVTRFVCVLRFAFLIEKTKRSCLVFNDSLTRDEYRKLLVYLHSS